MKKITLILFCNLFILCSPIKTVVRDDFRSASTVEKEMFLKKLNATNSDKSVLILTQGYKGEKIIATQGNKTVFSEYPISNLKTELADYFSFESTKPLLIQDNFSKLEVNIEPKKASKYKFIYLRKEYKKSVATYQVTYSNTLRPIN
jgi:hypothetical protein